MITARSAEGKIPGHTLPFPPPLRLRNFCNSSRDKPLQASKLLKIWVLSFSPSLSPSQLGSYCIAIIGNLPVELDRGL